MVRGRKRTVRFSGLMRLSLVPHTSSSSVQVPTSSMTGVETPWSNWTEQKTDTDVETLILRISFFVKAGSLSCGY